MILLIVEMNDSEARKASLGRGEPPTSRSAKTRTSSEATAGIGPRWGFWQIPRSGYLGVIGVLSLLRYRRQPVSRNPARRLGVATWIATFAACPSSPKSPYTK